MKTLLGVLAVAVGIIIIIVVARDFVPKIPGSTQKITKTETLTAQTQKLILEVAQTPKEQEIGLSGRMSIGDNQGMIFPFTQPGFYSFWMKNMKFPLDIIYTSKNKVVSIFKNVPNPTFPTNNLPIYKPELPADSVIELKGGQTDKLNIKNGDILNIAL